MLRKSFVMLSYSDAFLTLTPLTMKRNYLSIDRSSKDLIFQSSPHQSALLEARNRKTAKESADEKERVQSVLL